MISMAPSSTPRLRMNDARGTKKTQKPPTDARTVRPALNSFEAAKSAGRAAIWRPKPTEAKVRSSYVHRGPFRWEKGCPVPSIPYTTTSGLDPSVHATTYAGVPRHFFRAALPTHTPVATFQSADRSMSSSRKAVIESGLGVPGRAVWGGWRRRTDELLSREWLWEQWFGVPDGRARRVPSPRDVETRENDGLFV